jgi:hypothetical protein
MAGFSLNASSKGVHPSPGFGVFSEETKWNPSVGVTSTSPLLSPTASSLILLSPQRPLSRPCNVKLLPPSCWSEPSFVFYQFLELGSSALHATAPALQGTGAVLSTWATWIPGTLGHRNTHPCMSQDKGLDPTTSNGCCLMSSPALLRVVPSAHPWPFSDYPCGPSSATVLWVA